MPLYRFLVFLILLFATGHLPAQNKLRVAVAANMHPAMEAIAGAFEKKYNISVELVPGSSGKLSTQILQSAPYDLFVSADMEYPLELYRQGKATSAPKRYAQGVLVLWTLRQDLSPKADLSTLKQSAIKRIAYPNPKTAPYGRAAEEAMQYFKLYSPLQSKLITGESISQSSRYIQTLAVDIGFTAKSIVLNEPFNKLGTWVEVDPGAYSPIDQGLVILTYGKEKHPKESELLFNFMFEEKTKEILRLYGYKIVD